MSWLPALLLSNTLLFAQKNLPLVQTDLFYQGENGINTYRIPALVETPKHVLIAIVDARRDSSKDLPEHIALVMRRSFNLGKDWEPMRTVMEPARGGNGDASLLLDRSTGRVWCFFTYGPPGIGFWNSRAGELTGPQTIQIHAMHSDDDGATWSEPVDLTPQLKEPAWQAVFATSGTNIQIASGRFLLPLVVRDAKGVIHAANAYSDDHGKSWAVGELIGANTDESHNVELADGSILQNMRQDVRSIKARAIALSHDGGVTFGPIHYDEALLDPSCNAGFFRYRFGKKHFLVFTNAASTMREKLTIRLSANAGRSWPVARVINPGPSAYSTAVELHDGTIGVLYERGDHSEVEKITFARFGPEWVHGQ